MKKNNLNLNTLKLSLPDLLKLQQVSLHAFSIARHDFSNINALISGYSQLASVILGEFTDKGKSMFVDKARYNELVTALEEVRRGILIFSTSYSNLCDMYYRSDTADSFVSRPFNIFRTILETNKNTNITLGRNSLRTLEILFPENILFGIFTELVNNAEKHNNSKCQIKIMWRMEGRKFVFEIHDNGKGITNSRNYVPIDQLEIKATGLSLINRIVVLCEGHLLFSKSQYLCGTKVYLDFPIKAYYKKGVFYDFTKN